MRLPRIDPPCSPMTSVILVLTSFSLNPPVNHVALGVIRRSR